jgi:hypothetical protein
VQRQLEVPINDNCGTRSTPQHFFANTAAETVHVGHVVKEILPSIPWRGTLAV